MNILKQLHNKTYNSLDELSKATNMSLPLLSYHINGNLKSDGLKDLGVVETEENSGRLTIQLSMLGRMLVKGYITA
jgi:DNA-binding transcriptional ArsR family regulator